jgi:hypothetical protein
MGGIILINPQTIDDAVYLIYRLMTESSEEGDQLLKDFLEMMLKRRLALNEVELAKDELARLFIKDETLP